MAPGWPLRFRLLLQPQSSSLQPVIKPNVSQIGNGYYYITLHICVSFLCHWLGDLGASRPAPLGMII